MQRSFHWSLGLALALLVGGELGPDANAQGARPPTAEDLVSLRNAEDVQMAPSGNRVAFTVNEPPPEGKPRAEPSPSIWIVATEGENDPRRVTPADSAVYAPRWGPGGQTLAFLMKDADGEWQIFRQSVDGNTPEQVTRLDGGVGWSFAWSPDGARIAFTASDSTEAAKERGGDPSGDHAKDQPTPPSTWVACFGVFPLTDWRKICHSPSASFIRNARVCPPGPQRGA